MLIADALKLVPKIEYSNACSVVAYEEMVVAQTCGLLVHLSIAATTNDVVDVGNLTLQ